MPFLPFFYLSPHRSILPHACPPFSSANSCANKGKRNIIGNFRSLLSPSIRLPPHPTPSELHSFQRCIDPKRISEGFV